MTKIFYSADVNNYLFAFIIYSRISVFFGHILIFSNRYNLRSTKPIRLIYGYVVQNIQMNLTSKNRSFPINIKEDTKNPDISVRIGDFPEFFGYDVHRY